MRGQSMAFCMNIALTAFYLTVLSLGYSHATNILAIRLVDGPNRYTGRVEVLVGDSWGTICDDYWDMNDATVICRELGFGRAFAAPGNSYFGSGVGRIWLDNVHCSGFETSIGDCRHNSFGENSCNHGEDAGVRCTSDTSRQESFMILAEGSIQQLSKVHMNRPDQPRLPIPLQDVVRPVAVSYDPMERKVYWSDATHNYISRANLDGTSQEIVFSANESVCDGLTVDYVSRLLYWTDTTYGTITISSLDGSIRKTLISDNLHKPRGIAIDPFQRLMFWTDWGDEPRIEKAHADGTSRQILQNETIQWPNGITLDYKMQKLYWCDAGTDTIESCNYDGSLRSVVIDLHTAHPFDLVLDGSDLYWSDWLSSTVQRADNEGRNIKTALDTASQLFGLDIYRESRVIFGTTTCSVNNGNCDQLCIPVPNGHVCACGDSYVLNEDEISCSRPG